MNRFAAFGELERNCWSDRRRAADYVRLFSPAADQAVDSLLNAAGIEPGLKVLDVCCGQGNVAQALVKRGCHMVGVDFSSAMLNFARDREPHASFVAADAQGLPFDDATFDVVVSNFGMPHIPDHGRVLAEIRRVIAPGGRFATTLWCGPDVSPCMDVVYSILEVHRSPDVSPPPAPDFLQFARPDMAEKLLSRAGFSNIRFTIVDCAWDLDAPERLFEIFANGSFRAAMLLAGQSPDRVAAIRSTMTKAVSQRFKAGTRWRVPMPAALLQATPKGAQVGSGAAAETITL